MQDLMLPSEDVRRAVTFGNFCSRAGQSLKAKGPKHVAAIFYTLRGMPVSWWSALSDAWDRYVFRHHLRSLVIAFVLYMSAGTMLYQGCQLSWESLGANAVPVEVPMEALEQGQRPQQRHIVSGRHLEIGSAKRTFRASRYTRGYQSLIPLIADDPAATGGLQPGEYLDQRSIRLFVDLVERGSQSRIWLWDRHSSRARRSDQITVRHGVQGLIVGDASALPAAGRQALDHLPSGEVIIVVPGRQPETGRGLLRVIGGMFLAAGAILMTIPALRQLAETT